MNSIISIIAFIALVSFGSAVAEDDKAEDKADEFQHIIEGLLQKIRIIESNDIEELKRNAIPLELHFFAHMIKYDKTLRDIRGQLLNELVETGEGADECHAAFHKKLHHVIHKAARNFEHSARMKLDGIVSDFTALFEELLRMRGDSGSRSDRRIRFRLHEIENEVEMKAGEALDLPSKIREKWNTFENSEEVQSIVDEVKACYRGESYEPYAVQI